MEKKIILGSHVSMAKANKYLIGSITEALSYGSNCLMIYTGPNQSRNRADTSLLNIDIYLKTMEENNIDVSNLIIHSPYIVNLCSSKEQTREFSITFLAEELLRLKDMKAKYLVLHPGSATGQEKQVALDQIVFGINKAFEMAQVKDIYVCLETMAGKGTEIGSNFQELKYILDNTKNRTYVCFDTCHVYDAGYDIKDKYEEVINEFDRIIGINNIKVFHINDSKHGLNSHKDRHANIGYGHLGYEAILNICHDIRFKDIPKILETPYYLEKPYYKDEINIIQNKRWEDFLK